MKIDFYKLLESSKSEQRKIRNFYETFGYIEITNAIPKSRSRRLRKEYIESIERHTKTKWSKLKKASGGMHFIPNFQGSSEYYYSQLLCDIVYPVAKIFGGNKPAYLGSDASCFTGFSFNWHRDWNTRIPQLKFNVYLEDDIRIGGDHLVVPGSQHTFDQYSKMLSMGLEWPYKCNSDSGLDLNDFFPEITSPRISSLLEIFSKIKGDFRSIPYVRIKQNPTSLVLFDQRAVHCVQKPWPSRPQLLVTSLFAKDLNHENWSEEYTSLLPKLTEFSKEDYYKELFCLFIGERRMIDIPNYGPVLLNDSSRKLEIIETLIPEPFSSNEQKAKLSSWNNWIDLKDDLNGLEDLGKEIKSKIEPSQNMYTDLMMGINHRNINR